MESIRIEEDVYHLVDIVTSCLKRGKFILEEYKSLVRQNYLPLGSSAFLKSHWVPPKCFEVSAKWFREVAQKIGVGMDLEDAYAARSGFTLALIVSKHLMEYEHMNLPGDVKNYLTFITDEPMNLSFDMVAGHIWPTLASTASISALSLLRKVGERLSAYANKLRIVKRLAAPLVTFGILTDVLHAFGISDAYFTTSGYGRFANRLMDFVLGYERISADEMRRIIKSLTALTYVHQRVLEHLVDFVRRDWYGLAKWAVAKYADVGGIEGLYTEEDVRLDVVALVLAAASHYELNDSEGKRLLRRYLWEEYLTYPQITAEIVVSRFFARLVRIW